MYTYNIINFKRLKRCGDDECGLFFLIVSWYDLAHANPNSPQTNTHIYNTTSTNLLVME